jgi:SAM-dependent methyltransferase
MPAEFDRYAARGYSELLQDPIRQKFANPRFFHQRKLDLLRNWYQQRGVQTAFVRWLDLGCGEADLLLMGSPFFGEIAGCDISAGMIKSCEGIDLRVQDSPERIPFEGQSFDLVTAVCVYHHVDRTHRSTLTADVWRVLKPGGIFCIIEHNPLNPIARLIVRRCPLDVGAELLSTRETKRLAHDAGMKVLETKYFLYLPERLYKIFPRLETALTGVPLGGQYPMICEKSGL